MSSPSIAPMASFDTVTGVAAVALTTKYFLQARYNPDIEVPTELLCWIGLGLIIHTYSRFITKGLLSEANNENAGHYPKVIASAIVFASLCKSVEDARWIMPLLSPVLLVLRQREAKRILLVNAVASPGLFPSSIRNHLWIYGAVAAISTTTLAYGQYLPALLVGIGLFVALLALYASLDQVSTRLGGPLASPGFMFATIYHVVPLLASIFVFTWWTSPAPPFPIFDVVVMTALKMADWVLLVFLTQYVSWEVAVTSTTFAVSSFTALHIHHFALNTTARLFTACSALLQTISIIPKSAKTKNLLALLAVFPITAAILTIIDFTNQPHWPEDIIGFNQTNHPIELLIQKNTAEFDDMLERQSKTIESATREYKRRYRQEPPQGFGEWFNYALAQSSPVIDDFDLTRSLLEPFLHLRSKQLQRDIETAVRLPNARLFSLAIKQKEITFNNPTDAAWFVNDVKSLLGPILEHLPDLTLAINVLDEPRVLTSKTAPDYTTRVQFHEISHRSSWDEISRPCPTQGPPSFPHFEPTNDYGLRLIQNGPLSKDICLHSNYSKTHGLFQSPETLSYTTSPLPIFSQARFSSFSDLLYPSPHYSESSKYTYYTPHSDPRWSEKKSAVYWAGSTTGSHAKDNGEWLHYHRQRFMAFVQGIVPHNLYTFLSKISGVWHAVKSKDILSLLYKVRFTAAQQCTPAACKAEKSFFHISETTDSASEGFKYKFLFDIDGNSFSARFYRLMGSRSLVLKQTLFEEWHDERVIPWVHYIPISMEMEELPEVMRYLALTKEGEELSRKMAERASKWRRRSLRSVDRRIWLWRLLLEYARLFDEEEQNSI